MEILTIVMKDTEQTKYDRAKKRVDAIKGFYSHARAYVIVNLILLILRANVVSYIRGGEFDTLDFQNWLNWNTYITPVLWGVGLALHGIFVFHGKINAIKNWEERKLKEFMDKEDSDTEKFK
jgi:hypothetical protein